MVDEREEDRVRLCWPTGRIMSVAEDETQRVSRLVIRTTPFRWVRLRGVEVFEAWKLERVCEVGGGEAVAEELGECTPDARGGEVVVDVGLASAGKEEHPVLLHGRAGGGWVSGELCERLVGFQGPEGGILRGRGKEGGEGWMQGAQVDEPEAEATVAGSDE